MNISARPDTQISKIDSMVEAIRLLKSSNKVTLASNPRDISNHHGATRRLDQLCALADEYEQLAKPVSPPIPQAEALEHFLVAADNFADQLATFQFAIGGGQASSAEGTPLLVGFEFLRPDVEVAGHSHRFQLGRCRLKIELRRSPLVAHEISKVSPRSVAGCTAVSVAVESGGNPNYFAIWRIEPTVQPAPLLGKFDLFEIGRAISNRHLGDKAYLQVRLSDVRVTLGRDTPLNRKESEEVFRQWLRIKGLGADKIKLDGTVDLSEQALED